MQLRIGNVRPALDGIDGELLPLRGEFGVPDGMEDFEDHAGLVAEQP